MNMMARSLGRQAQVRVLNSLGALRSFFDAAADYEVIWPSRVMSGKPAFVLPGQYERATGAAFGVDLQNQIRILRGGNRLVKGTTLYRFTNSLIAGSRVISNLGYEEFSWPSKRWSFQSPSHIAVGTLKSSYLGCRFFGHWLRDDCATSRLNSIGHQINIPAPAWGDKESYLKFFEIHMENSSNDLFVDDLYYYDDVHQNEHKRDRFIQLRQLLRKKIHRTGNQDVVYIRRGATAKARPFVNEDAVIEALAARGVKIVCAEDQDTGNFIASILDASLVISVEGSQISHALYTLKSGGSVIAIQPPDRLFVSHYEWASIMDVGFGVIVGTPQLGGFSVAPEDVLRTIDLAQHA